MSVYRVRFSEKERQLIVSEIREYCHLLDKLCITMFLPPGQTYEIVDEAEPADFCIVGIQHTDNSLLRENETNIFLSLENFSVGRTHYQHFNTFGRYANPMIKYFIYNDISEVVELDNDRLAIPTLFFRLAHFSKLQDLVKFSQPCPFEQKKFCIFTSRNGLNQNKNSVLQQLSLLGRVDFLSQYDQIIKDKTCYHDPTLLSIYNQYKFVICFENSKTDGYITEKIFNVFLSKSIPIYDGAPNVGEYLYPNSFLAFDVDLFEKVRLLMNNPKLYEAVVQYEKIKRSPPITYGEASS